MATNPAPACECDTMTSVAASRDAVRREPLYPTELGRLRHTRNPRYRPNAQANLPEPLDRRHEMVGEDHEGADPPRPTARPNSCSRRSRSARIADDVVAAIAASHRAVDRAGYWIRIRRGMALIVTSQPLQRQEKTRTEPAAKMVDIVISGAGRELPRAPPGRLTC